MQSEEEKLDFSYRFPFSKAALEIIGRASQSVEEKYLRLGKLRLEEDLAKRSPDFAEVNIAEIKKSIVVSYVYSRMLASALNDRYLLNIYINAECSRVRSALASGDPEDAIALSEELGMAVHRESSSFYVRFDQFLMNRPKGEAMSLATRSLDRGKVYLTAQELAGIMAEAARKKIAANLPISAKQLPKEVVEYAKNVKRPVRRIKVAHGKTYRWIEKMLETPIPDFRHRTINLVLAPYLVNVKNMPEDEAAKIIADFIEKCKELNPDTRVNQSYINYQCRYAKSKGLRPLSLKRAKELYEGTLDLGV